MAVPRPIYRVIEQCVVLVLSDHRARYEHNAQSSPATSIAIKINPQIMDVRLSRRETASLLSKFKRESKTKRRLAG
jgi:hypothetical protein